jgi:putative ABC transport system permease protein
MKVWHFIFREIFYRKLNSFLSLLSIVFAVGCLVSSLLLLRAHDLKTEEMMAAVEAENAEDMSKLEADVRNITKNLGFNIQILPKDQKLADLYADDFASKYMPENYAEKLSLAHLVTVNHLLPSLQQKLKWPEQKRTVILIGTRGEVFVQNEAQKPILGPVPPKTLILGYELHQSLKLKPGDKVQFAGRDFRVSKCNEERGSKDDISVWMNLAEAQEILNKPGLINSILALNCHCSGERLPKIREEIQAMLPDTQVIEFASQAIARAEARDTAAAAAEKKVLDMKVTRGNLRKDREAFASVLVPLVLVGCAVGLGILTFGNVRERSSEIGILRALGFRSVQVMSLFLGKAILVGFVGAIFGYLGGHVVGSVWGQASGNKQLFDVTVFLSVIVLTPVLTAVVSWLPALRAAEQDPAAILGKDV